jgi:hypothetical protein
VGIQALGDLQMHIRTFVRATLTLGCVALLVAGCRGADNDSPSLGAPSPGSQSTSSQSTSAQSTTAAGRRTSAGSTSPEGTSAGATGGGEAPVATSARRTLGPPSQRTPSAPVAVSSLPPVRVGNAARLDRRVSVTIPSVRDIEVSASGPGEVAGHGVSVHVRVHNTTTAAVNLSGFAVTASYGQGTPASPTDSGGAAPLTGMLAPGDAADGTYVFLVPAAQSSTLRVEVSSDESPNIAVFQR